MAVHDVAIIGAGPIGIELAIALKLLGVDYIHFDGGQVGQTVSWYPSQTRFFSSPERIALAGVPLQTMDQEKATREEYLAYLRGLVQQFDLRIRTYERVVRIDRPASAATGTRLDEDDALPDQTFTLYTQRSDESNVYEARRLVLAVGDMSHPRLLHVPGEDLPHVSHYFREPHAYFQQRVLIVGGRNSAAEAAIRLHRIGAHVSS